MSKSCSILFARQRVGWHPFVFVVLLSGALLVPPVSALDAKKSVRRGNSTLGATINLAARDSRTPDRYRVDSQAEVTARLLGNTVALGEAAGAVITSSDGAATVQLRLIADGKTLVNYVNHFGQNCSFVIPSYVTSKDLPETTVWAGPVPIKVKARASISLAGSGSVQVLSSPHRLPTVRANLFSSLNACARGSAHAHRDLASVALRGDARFAKANLITRAKLTPSTTNDFLHADAEVAYALAQGEGNWNAQAKIQLPLAGSKTYSRTLGSFLGPALSGRLGTTGRTFLQSPHSTTGTVRREGWVASQ